MGRSVHHIPGRIRFKVARLDSNRGLATALRRGLERQQGVEHVETRPMSSSVIVLYDPRRADVSGLMQFVKAVAERALAEQAGVPVQGIDLQDAVAKSLSHAGRVFAQTAFKVALEQVVRSGFNSASRAA